MITPLHDIKLIDKSEVQLWHETVSVDIAGDGNIISHYKDRVTYGFIEWIQNIHNEGSPSTDHIGVFRYPSFMKVFL